LVRFTDPPDLVYRRAARSGKALLVRRASVSSQRAAVGRLPWPGPPRRAAVPVADAGPPTSRRSQPPKRGV